MLVRLSGNPPSYRNKPIEKAGVKRSRSARKLNIIGFALHWIATIMAR
jgi:hypothetical protein